MTKDQALGLLDAYCMGSGDWADLSDVLQDAAGMSDRFPEGGSESKAMRWLGYMQGVLVSHNVYTLEDVKRHSMAWSKA